MAKRLYNILLKNKHIDTSVQKGSIPGISGGMEHTGVVTQLIGEAREDRRGLSVLRIDLTNAYDSIPHKLVEGALKKHHAHQKVKDLILDYYCKFSSSCQLTSDWHQHDVGIITMCTISVALFSLAMKKLVKAAEPECRGTPSKWGVRQPPIRAFMDDLTVTTTAVPGAWWILQGLERIMAWARMSFKPAKSRSLVLKNGRVRDKLHFKLG